MPSAVPLLKLCGGAGCAHAVVADGPTDCQRVAHLSFNILVSLKGLLIVMYINNSVRGQDLCVDRIVVDAVQFLVVLELLARAVILT